MTRADLRERTTRAVALVPGDECAFYSETRPGCVLAAHRCTCSAQADAALAAIRDAAGGKAHMMVSIESLEYENGDNDPVAIVLRALAEGESDG